MKRQQLIQKVEELDINVFAIKDLRKMFPDETNLKVSVKRMLDAGVIVQVRRGLYTLKQEKLDIEKIATQLYYPSYVSFESALSKYGIINQGLFVLTLATTRHTKSMFLAGIECQYSKLNERLFFGFDLTHEVYLAHPEKAFLDQVYLISQGKRSCDYSDWYLEDLDRDRLKEYLKVYPCSVKKQVAKLGF